MKTPELTPSQKNALRALLETRENLFITGAPGTGKSFLVSRFLKESQRDIPVTASTGAAALLVGGRTFHSFFGLGILQGGAAQVIERALRDSRLKKRLRDADTILVDEISMLPYPALDIAEKLARLLRGNEEPWGGIRMLVIGDFAQLPPISRSGQREWAFMGDAWARSRFRTVMLREIKRSEDQDFLAVLSDIRQGVISTRVEDFLDSCVREDDAAESDVPRIFPRRFQTETFNRSRLEALESPLRTYPTEYLGGSRWVERLMNDAPVPALLELKEGALVMFRVNDPRGRFVNGTVGRVSGLHDGLLEVEVRDRLIEIEPFSFTVLDEEGFEAASARNFPVSLAWASTIHKIQGATLDQVHADLRRLWEPGQGYVALSRVRRASGITLAGWDSATVLADPRVRVFEEACETEVELA